MVWHPANRSLGRWDLYSLHKNQNLKNVWDFPFTSYSFQPWSFWKNKTKQKPTDYFLCEWQVGSVGKKTGSVTLRPKVRAWHKPVIFEKETVNCAIGKWTPLQPFILWVCSRDLPAPGQEEVVPLITATTKSPADFNGQKDTGPFTARDESPGPRGADGEGDTVKVLFDDAGNGLLFCWLFSSS
jgi:hypothetical protein